MAFLSHLLHLEWRLAANATTAICFTPLERCDPHLGDQVNCPRPLVDHGCARDMNAVPPMRYHIELIYNAARSAVYDEEMKMKRIPVSIDILVSHVVILQVGEC